MVFLSIQLKVNDNQSFGYQHYLKYMILFDREKENHIGLQ